MVSIDIYKNCLIGQNFNENAPMCNSGSGSSAITNSVQCSTTTPPSPPPGNLEKSRSGATSPQTSEISGNLTLLYESHSVFGYTHTPLPLEISFQKIF